MVQDLGEWFNSPESMVDESDDDHVRKVTSTADQRDYYTAIHTNIVDPPTMSILTEVLRVFQEKTPATMSTALHNPACWLVVFAAPTMGTQKEEWKNTGRQLMWQQTAKICTASRDKGWGQADDVFNVGGNQQWTTPSCDRSVVFVGATPREQERRPPAQPVQHRQ